MVLWPFQEYFGAHIIAMQFKSRTAFDSLECKRAVLKSASRLRASAISSHRGVYISPDLTRKQREIEYQLRVELKASVVERIFYVTLLLVKFYFFLYI